MKIKDFHGIWYLVFGIWSEPCGLTSCLVLRNGGKNV